MHLCGSSGRVTWESSYGSCVGNAQHTGSHGMVSSGLILVLSRRTSLALGITRAAMPCQANSPTGIGPFQRWLRISRRPRQLFPSLFPTLLGSQEAKPLAMPHPAGSADACLAAGTPCQPIPGTSPAPISGEWAPCRVPGSGALLQTSLQPCARRTPAAPPRPPRAPALADGRESRSHVLALTFA